MKSKHRKPGTSSSKRAPMLVSVIVAGVALAYSVSMLSPPKPKHPFFERFDQQKILTIAHRGGALLWPENTMLAFEESVAMGADMLELDVHFSADGGVVVIHDDTVDRTTCGSGYVSAFSLEQLRKLDAAYGFMAPEKSVPSFRGKGLMVPTLEEVFERFPSIPMIVEIKENNTELADAVLSLVRRFERVQTTLLGSFHHEILEYIRKVEPAVATHASGREILPLLVLSWFYLEGWINPAYDAVLVPTHHGKLEITTRRFLSAAHNRGVFSAAWTINEPNNMQSLVEKGVGGLITDRPDLALSFRSSE